MVNGKKTESLRHIHNIKSSLPEVRISTLLVKLSIGFIHSFYVKTRQNRYFQFDFKLLNVPILIEVNGDFWHANPQYYSADDILCFPGGIKKTAAEIWEKDRIKLETAQELGYSMVYIWENEITNKKDKAIISLLLERIGRIVDEHCKD